MNIKTEVFLLLFLICKNVQATITSICIENCDTEEIKTSDPTKPIKFMALCTGSKCSMTTFEWSLVPTVGNTKQSFEPNDIIGATSELLTIKANVLTPGEQYFIQLKITTGEKINYLNPKVNMDRCSKKFPCGESEDDTIPPDYIGDDSFEESVAGLSSSHLTQDIQISSEKLQVLDKKSKIFKETRRKMLTMLQYVSLQTKDEIKFCSDKLKELIKVSDSVPFEPIAAKLVIQAARKLTNARLPLLKKAKDPTKMADEVKEASKDVLSIIKVALNISEEQLTSHLAEQKKKAEKFVVEAPFQEDYPIYDDFDDRYQGKLENFEEIGDEITRMIENIAEANVRIMQGKISQETTISDDICIMSILDKPEEFSEKVYTICDVSFHITYKLAKELGSLMKMSAISLGVLKKNIFWWKSKNAIVKLVYAEIDDSKMNTFDPITILKNPIIFYMDVKHEKTQKVEAVFKILPNQTEIRSEDISLIQLIPHKTIKTIIIEFGDLGADNKIKVVILKNQIPLIKDFEDSSKFISIPRNSTEKLTIIHSMTIADGSFGYVGVLPTRETLNKSGKVLEDFLYFNYSVKFTRLSCDLWDDDQLLWDSDSCSVHENTTSEKTFCSCYHTSIFAVSSSNIEIRRIEDWEMPLRLEVQFNFVVLITLCVFLFIFILAFLFARWRQRKLRKDKIVLFLLDNHLDYTNNYEYLICVFTGSKNLSGTTANIGIQIYGSLANSDYHLLRGHYEPVLQKGSEDWFYLLTPTDLGELKSIDLWTDCHGLRVSWYCKKIEVHSVHENRKWIFEVHQWLTILNDNIQNTFPGTLEGIEMVRSRCDYAKFGQKSHIWITPFSNLGNSPFTYLERLAVILCIVLLNLLMAMVMLGVPSPDIAGQFGRGHFSFEFAEFGMAFLCGLVSFLFSWILIYLFESSEATKLDTERKSKFASLTRMYDSVARILLVVLIVVSLGVLAILGLWFNYTSSLVWIPIFLLGILFSITFELIRVCLTAAILKKGERKIVHQLNFSEIEEQKELLLERYGVKGMRMLFYKLYHPITEMQCQIKKEKELQRIKLRSVLVDIIMFTIYIVILFNVVLLNKSGMAHRFTRNVENIFIGDKVTGKSVFLEINSGKGLFRYLEKVFFPALYTTSWYGDYNSSESGLLVDFNTKLLGIPRVRQQRVKPNSCGLHHSMVGPSEAQRCHADLTMFNVDRNSYGPRWEEMREVPAGASGVESRKIWLYQDGYESVSIAYAGELGHYFSGGYVANFGRNLENSLLVLEYIKNNNWIDARTRALFFEAYFYNANQNLFCFLTLIIERSATAKFIPNHQIRTLRLLFMHGDLAIRSLIIFVCLIIMMILFTWRKYKEFRVDIWFHFFTNAWHIIDLLIIITGLVFIAVYFVRSLAVTKLISVLEESAHNEFISFNHVLYWDDAVSILATVLVTISTIRLWKMFRFLRIFRICERTLTMASRYLLAVALISTFFLIAYSTCGHIIFGPYSENFRTISQGFVTLLLHALGFTYYFNFTVLEEAYWAIGPTYYFFFMLIFFYVINIFIAIIIVAYEGARDYVKECEKNNLVSYHLLDYLKDEWKYFKSKTKGREFDDHLRAGEEHMEIGHLKNVHPKPDVSRKHVRINSSRMTSIHFIAADILEILLDKNSGLENIDISDYDGLIAELVSNIENKRQEKMRDKTEDDLFIVIPDDDLYKYIATHRLEDMYTIVDYLLRNSGKMINPEPNLMLDNKVALIMSMNSVVLEMIKDLENLSQTMFVDESTNVTFSDFGLEIVDDSDPDLKKDTRHGETSKDKNVDRFKHKHVMYKSIEESKSTDSDSNIKKENVYGREDIDSKEQKDAESSNNVANSDSEVGSDENSDTEDECEKERYCEGEEQSEVDSDNQTDNDEDNNEPDEKPTVSKKSAHFQFK